MENTLLRSKLLEQARNLYVENIRIYSAINAALEEDEAYAADELVELAEEILNQIAAVGFVHYLKVAPQKEVYNDFLVQLFNSSGHEYNAGPLFRWAANMVKDCPEMQKSKRYQFFWEQEDNNYRLASKVQHLSEQRNQVMHGFFVLPPEVNRKEADAIGQLLIDLHSMNFFNVDAHLHFYSGSLFAGRWNITEDTEWTNYFSFGNFGLLATRIVSEQSGSFWEHEQVLINNIGSVLPDQNKSKINNFIAEKNRGAFAVWVHPADNTADQIYAGLANQLKAIPNTLLVSYGLHEQGISFTGGFLLRRLLNVLDPDGKLKSKNKKPEDLLAAARKLTSQKVIVLINRIHIALFSPQHVTLLNNLLYENDILLLVVGNHYEHFDGFFNDSTTIEHEIIAPNAEQTLVSLRNYLRFKGPSYEKADEIADVKQLETIILRLLQELSENKKIYARRFADDNEYHSEYVHEAFALLYPWVRSSRETFEPDVLDETYGFPSTMTEVTPIYLALGRRDLKLEYQHKVISL
jgi:hypothetical protein